MCFSYSDSCNKAEPPPAPPAGGRSCSGTRCRCVLERSEGRCRLRSLFKCDDISSLQTVIGPSRASATGPNHMKLQKSHTRTHTHRDHRSARNDCLRDFSRPLPSPLVHPCLSSSSPQQHISPPPPSLRLTPTTEGRWPDTC